MKKQLLATLVGGIILFVWQFLSWALIPIHKSEGLVGVWLGWWLPTK